MRESPEFEAKVDLQKKKRNQIKGINDLGTACILDRKIWVKAGLQDLETIEILLHECWHLYHLKILKCSLPGDRAFMERDSEIWASEKLSKYYLIAKTGEDLDGPERIKTGFNLYKNL